MNREIVTYKAAGAVRNSQSVSFIIYRTDTKVTQQVYVSRLKVHILVAYIP